MQTRTAIALAAAFTVGMALFPMSAKAICEQTFYADRGFSDGTMTQILGRTNTVTDPNAFQFAYFAETTNPVLANSIFAAVAHHNLVFIVGGAAACPTTGALRDIGTIIQIFISP